MGVTHCILTPFTPADPTKVTLETEEGDATPGVKEAPGDADIAK